jgi:transposase
VQGIIDAWMEQDRGRPRKQRHTATRIWQRLREEYGYAGSESAVRRYVAARKATREGEVFLPLVFDPGEEAQVDWGEAWAVIGGEECKVHLFCMRLAYSRASYVRAYERTVQEAFLDGHVRAFAFFTGVPHRLAYDNLKSAVISVGKGTERTLHPRFLQLRSHYLFRSRFCNVASGNEKGHVENLVKYAQRTLMTPIPQVADLAELNRLLEEGCRKSLQEPAGRTGGTRGEMFQEESMRLMPLPGVPFGACREISTIATKQALVRFEGNDYSVPVEWALHPCVVRAYVERVRLVADGQEIASHVRSWREGEFVLDPYHYLPLLERKPGSLDNARPFKGEPWGPQFARMRSELEYRYGGEGTRRYVRILLLMAEHPVEEVRQAVQVCVDRGAFSDEAVLGMLSYVPPLRVGHLDLSGRPELAQVGSGIRPAGRYDTLRGREAV